MITKILFIQPFLLEKTHFTDEILIWEVYLENFLKSKIEALKFDLIYLPIERKLGNLKLTSFSEVESFQSQMDFLISDLSFELDDETLICISGTSSTHFLSSKLIAEYFQKSFPSSIIVFGGAHASARPDDFRYINSPFDYIIKGEGEISLYNLIKTSPKKQDIPKIINNHPVPDLNELPPIDFEILNKYIKNFNHLSINLSRGCPFNCNFCMEKELSNGVSEVKRWRVYSPKRAINEVKQMVEYGKFNSIKAYGFYDPIFGMNKKWLENFLHAFDFDSIPYAWIETRLDILNEKLLNLLQKNRLFLMYGLESYSKKMLFIMNKSKNPTMYLKKFEEVYQIHKKIESPLALNLILNHPGETRDTYKETFNRLIKIVNEDETDITHLNIAFYHHFPGTKTYNKFNYFNKEFGAKMYVPEWWKEESSVKLGAYCIRPSKELSLKESIKLYTTSYQDLLSINLQNIKKSKINGKILKAIRVKQEINTVENLGKKILTFIQDNDIGFIDHQILPNF